jgi:hypothetical protein
MKHIQDFESFLNEYGSFYKRYRNVGSTTKIAGKYVGEYKNKSYQFQIAGFEREDEDHDSLYFLDSEPLKKDWGTITVPNEDMVQLSKGQPIFTATIKKTGETILLRRIGDFMS